MGFGTGAAWNYAATGGARPRIRRSRAALAPKGERWRGREAIAAKLLEAWCAGAQRAHERACGGRDPEGEREHGAGEDAEREQAEPAAAQQRARAEPGGERRLGAAGEPDGAGGERPQAPEARRGAGEPRDEQRKAEAVEHEREHAGRLQPELAASRQLWARGPHSSAARVWSAPTASSGSSTRARRVRDRWRISSHDASADQRRLK